MEELHLDKIRVEWESIKAIMDVRERLKAFRSLVFKIEQSMNQLTKESALLCVEILKEAKKIPTGNANVQRILSYPIPPWNASADRTLANLLPIYFRITGRELPTFKYYPNLFADGIIQESDIICIVCNQSRGCIYTGPIFGEIELAGNCICPWCIKDGSASRKLKVTFNDSFTTSSDNLGQNLPNHIREEVEYRTPGYYAWQEATWFYHCSDAAEFLGLAGREELDSLGAGAEAAIRESLSAYGIEDAKLDEMMSYLHKDGLTAYVFRCTKCEKYLGYTDSD